MKFSFKSILLVGTICFSICLIYSTNFELTDVQSIQIDPTPIISNKPEIFVDDYKDDIRCLQKNIYFESRNQKLGGKIATAWVTLNRVYSNYYPNDVCSVVYQAETDRNGNPIKDRCKFSWYCDGLKDRPSKNPVEQKAWIDAEKIASTIIISCLLELDYKKCPDDPTNGALYYHNTKVAPKWSMVYNRTAQIGSHIYYARN